MDLSDENSHPYISNQPENPLQFTIHLPQPSGSNGEGVQSPNSNPGFGENPSTSASSVPDQFLYAPIPKGRRCVRPRNPAPCLNPAQTFSCGSRSNCLGNAGGSAEASTSGHASKAQLENSGTLIPKSHVSGSSFGNLAKRAVDDMSEEIIVINKEATSEALIALTAGFPADSLTEEEIDYGVVSVVGGIEQVNYILIRNHIIRRWRDNVSSWIAKEMFIDIVPKHCWKLLDTAYGYLVSHGYINFGVAPAIKERTTTELRQASVIVIGAGLAGLAAARQLMAFGVKVTVLEGRKRAGGRVYTKKLEGNNIVAAADLGGSVLTGTLGNPLGILARQLSFTLHKVRDKCPLYRVDGTPVDPNLDRRVENSFNQLLDKLSKIRLSMGAVSQDVSLGAALETFRENFNEEEISLFNWHLANLEYANASLVSNLSLAFWDQDDPYDMGGDHCFLPGGNGGLVQALAEGVPMYYEKTVQAIRYSSNGVKVAVTGGQIYEGDMALCTVPLGVLKNGSIKFIPELPQRKLDAIRRLGFGLLNKVALLFPYAFWGTELDTFGHLSDHPSRRGEFFLFYSYATVAGGPILIGLVAGEAAYKFEIMEPTDAVERVLRILRDIYEPKGIQVPDPVQTVCTRWGTDPLSCGSYSNVAVGASGDDYDILAESVGDGRLFFAGEATNRRYPATMHGAFLSGFREAANMVHHAKVRFLRLKVEKNPSQNAHTCATILADLFRKPDLEFGSFAVLLGRKDADSMAILRVAFGGHRKKPDQQYSNKLLFEQLQSHFNQQLEFHVYTLLSKQQALELREVRGGDDGRLNYLEKVGVKLLGRKGLGLSADSVIASIKAERSGQGHIRIQKSPLSGLPKSKVSTNNTKVIRKAKVVGRSNTSSIPSTNPQNKVSSTVMDMDSRILATSNGSAYLSSDIRVRPFISNKDLPPPNSSYGTDLGGDIRHSIPHNLGQSNCVITPFGSNDDSAASNNSNTPDPLNSNAGMMFPWDVQGPDPHNFLADRLNPANFNSSVRVLNTNCSPTLPHVDGHSNLLNNAIGSNTQNYVSSKCLVAPLPSVNGTGVVSSSSGLVHSNLTTGSYNTQNYDVGISDGISSISNQENIFDEIMNDLLPPTGTNSGTWQSTGKL